MSVSIGLGYRSSRGEELYYEIQQIAREFGYGTALGIDTADFDVVEGLKTAANLEEWDHVVLFNTAEHAPANLAFGIYLELQNLELKKERPKFFDLLGRIDDLVTPQTDRLGVFFASEWNEQDDIRYQYGDMETLTLLLSFPGHCFLRLLSGKTGRVNEFDGYPLLFSVKNKNSGV